MRILVVEDDALVREFVVEVLREQGYDVIHAANGEEALAWCGRHAADVLITDVRLPGGIAERCRERDPGLPVIYATGFSPVAPPPGVRKPDTAEALPFRGHREGGQAVSFGPS